MLSVQYALANTKPAPGSDGLSGTVGSSLSILGARKRGIQSSAADAIHRTLSMSQVSPDSRGALALPPVTSTPDIENAAHHPVYASLVGQLGCRWPQNRDRTSRAAR